jgi:tripartite-type tricarboxylate transporter receptor subunit TctC
VQVLKTTALRFAVAAALAYAGAVAAQTWPNRALTFVVTFAPGGGDDVLARVVGPRLSEVLGHPVVIENVSGAGGMTGVSRVVKAAPDGYQFVLGGTGTFAANQTLYKHPLYDPRTDFAPVMLLAELPIVLVVRKDLPADNLTEFIAYARANQAKMQFGSPGTSSASHLACVLLNAAIGIDVIHVPCRGGAPAYQDLLAGRIDYLCPYASTAIPQIESKSVKPIAILTRNRLPALPNLPTAQEQGLADFEAYNWFALFLPRGTPSPVIQKLHDAAAATIDTPSVQERLAQIGATPVGPERRSPEFLQMFVASEIEKWARAIKAANIKPEQIGSIDSPRQGAPLRAGLARRIISRAGVICRPTGIWPVSRIWPPFLEA